MAQHKAVKSKATTMADTQTSSATSPAPVQAVSMIKQRIQALRADPKTSNAGEKWSLSEDQRLVTALKDDGKSMEEIASEHRRTQVSVVQRARRLAIAAVSSGRSVSEVAPEFRMTIDELSKLVKQRTATNERRAAKKRPVSSIDETSVASTLSKMAASLEAIEKRIALLEQSARVSST